MYLAADMSWRMNGLTPCETLSRSFYFFRERPALGERKKLADGTLGDFEWLTYGEVELRACLFACGLMALGVKRVRNNKRLSLVLHYRDLLLCILTITLPSLMCRHL